MGPVPCTFTLVYLVDVLSKFVQVGSGKKEKSVCCFRNISELPFISWVGITPGPQDSSGIREGLGWDPLKI